MRRVVAIASMILTAALGSLAFADAVDTQITSLTGGSVKLRLTAAASLARTTDDRASIALAVALRQDTDASVRQAAALALKKSVTSSIGKRARILVRDALKAAADKKTEPNKKVRAAAAKTYKALKKYLATPKGPPVFVNIDTSVDNTKRAPARAITELDKTVKKQISRASYAIEWPDEQMPTGKELKKNGTTAFLVRGSITKLGFDKKGSKVTVSCSLLVEVSPWTGTDGGERWVEGETAKASGSGAAESGTSDGSMAGGVIECVKAVGERIVGDKIAPHIKKLTKQ